MLAAKPPTAGTQVFEFWKGETRSRIAFVDVLAKSSLIRSGVHSLFFLACFLFVSGVAREGAAGARDF